MTTNEPTAGEIVRALRTCNNRKGERCSQCPVFSKYGYPRTCKRTVDLKAADRLESQEHEIEELKSEAIVNALENAERIANMTARAEQAERERDVLKLEFATIEEDGLCSVCKFESSIPLLQCMEDCCFKHRGLSVLSVDGVSGDGTERRGLPQEGERK